MKTLTTCVDSSNAFPIPRRRQRATPIPWRLFNDCTIGRDSTKRRRDGNVDGRVNESYVVVAKVYLSEHAKFIVSACNRVSLTE